MWRRSVSRSSVLQIYVTPDLAERVRGVAVAHGLDVSQWVRSLLVRACDGDIADSENRTTVGRLHRQAMFAMVGIDALLAGHPDPKLRNRAHQAFARKCREACLVAGTDDGGRDEA